MYSFRFVIVLGDWDFSYFKRLDLLRPQVVGFGACYAAAWIVITPALHFLALVTCLFPLFLVLASFFSLMPRLFAFFPCSFSQTEMGRGTLWRSPTCSALAPTALHFLGLSSQPCLPSHSDFPWQSLLRMH